jgi:hypothetical protein
LCATIEIHQIVEESAPRGAVPLAILASVTALSLLGETINVMMLAVSRSPSVSWLTTHR